MSHPACGRLLAGALALSPAFREIAFLQKSTPRAAGATRELDVWPGLAWISWDHAPDKISYLLHFRGGLWCPVTFATVYCCSFETAKNGELCQTTQNFKPHQLQLGTPGESCLNLSPLAFPALQLTEVLKITGSFYPSHSFSRPLKILDCSGS